MKKLFLILTLIILGTPVFAHNADIIKDELLDPATYNDMSGNSIFHLGIYEHKPYQYVPVEDELIDKDFISMASDYAIVKKDLPDDFFFEKNIDATKSRKILPKTKYDFTKKQIPIQVKISEHLKSTRNILEGSTIPFVAQNDFEINGRKYDSGTIILGRVETISASDKMGTPESIKISNFFIPDEKIELYGSVSKIGANRSIWVYPLYQAGNIAFYVAGFVFVPIHGGRVKLLTSESFTLFYETQ